MSVVTNKYGQKINFSATVPLMDDNIRERIHEKLAPCSEQQFFDAYCEEHRKRYGEEFEPNKLNPTW